MCRARDNRADHARRYANPSAQVLEGARRNLKGGCPQSMRHIFPSFVNHHITINHPSVSLSEALPTIYRKRKPPMASINDADLIGYFETLSNWGRWGKED